MPSTDPGPARRLPEALLGHTGYLAVRFGRQAQREFERGVADLGLRPPDYDFLSTVAEFGPISQKDAAAALGVDPARVVALTDQLQRRRLVRRTVDPEDRRRNLVSLTRSGQDLVARAEVVARSVEADLVATLTSPERQALRSLLQRVLEADLSRRAGD